MVSNCISRSALSTTMLVRMFPRFEPERCMKGAMLIAAIPRGPVPRLRQHAVLARQRCAGRAACTALGDLLGWLESSAQRCRAATEEVGAWSREHPKKAAAVFAEAIAIREALFRHLRRLRGRGGGARPGFRGAEEGPGRGAGAQPARARRRQLRLADRADPADGARSAGAGVCGRPAILCSRPARRRIRQCANEKCLWLFVDEQQERHAGAGATWPPAATAPRPGATTRRSSTSIDRRADDAGLWRTGAKP